MDFRSKTLQQSTCFLAFECVSVVINRILRVGHQSSRNNCMQRKVVVAFSGGPLWALIRSRPIDFMKSNLSFLTSHISSIFAWMGLSLQLLMHLTIRHVLPMPAWRYVNCFNGCFFRVVEFWAPNHFFRYYQTSYDWSIDCKHCWAVASLRQIHLNFAWFWSIQMCTPCLTSIAQLVRRLMTLMVLIQSYLCFWQGRKC